MEQLIGLFVRSCSWCKSIGAVMVRFHFINLRLRRELASIGLATITFLFLFIAYFTILCIIGWGKSLITTDFIRVQLQSDGIMIPNRPLCMWHWMLLVDRNRPVSVLANMLNSAFFTSRIYNISNFLIEARSELLIFVALNWAFSKDKCLLVVLCSSHLIGKVDLEDLLLIMPILSISFGFFSRYK